MTMQVENVHPSSYQIAIQINFFCNNNGDFLILQYIPVGHSVLLYSTTGSMTLSQ